MARKALLFVLIVFGFLLLYAFYQTQVRSPAVAQTTPSVQTTTTTTLPARGTAFQTDPPLNNEERLRLQSEAQALDSMISGRRAELEEQRQNLESLKAQKNQEQLQLQQTTASYPSQISSRQLEIQNLIEELENQRLAENEINQAADLALRSQSHSAQVIRSQLDDDIRVMEQNIQQTREQLSFWSNTIYLNDRTLQETRLSELRNQLTGQTQELESLRAQKAELFVSVLADAQTLNQSSQQQKSDLDQEQSFIQDQIRALREDIRNLEQRQSQTKMTSISLDSQIAQAQNQIEAQSQEIREMEDALQERQDQLRQIQ